MAYNCQSILGVIIGTTFIFCSCLFIINKIKFLNDFEQSVKDGASSYDQFAEFFIYIIYIKIIIASIAIVTTALLIIGILTKCRYLLIPSMCLTVAIIIGQCLILLYGFVVGRIGNGALYLGVELLVFYCTYMLYEDIRKAKKESERIALQTNQQNVPNYGHRTSIAKKYIQDGEN